MEVSVELKGVKELYARLDELDAIGQKKLLGRVVRRVAKPTADAAKSNLLAFRKSGALAAAVNVYATRPRGQEVVSVQVAAQKKHRVALFAHNAFYGRRLKGIFYGHLLEWGHRIGTRKTGYLKKLTRPSGAGGTSTGKVAPRRWLSPAVSAHKARMVSSFAAEMRRALDAVARRRGQKSANSEGLVPP